MPIFQKVCDEMQKWRIRVLLSALLVKLENFHIRAKKTAGLLELTWYSLEGVASDLVHGVHNMDSRF